MHNQAQQSADGDEERQSRQEQGESGRESGVDSFQVGNSSSM